jgi:hypothetical protein
VNLAKLVVGLGPAVLWLSVCTAVHIHDRLAERKPALQAAIYRHPSMQRRALWPAPCCGEILSGTDPWDLVAAQMTHDLICLKAENAA